MPIVPELRPPQDVRLADRLIERAIAYVRNALIAAIADIEMLKATPDWIQVPSGQMLNGWIPYDTARTPAYWKDPWGRVHLRGSVKTGTIGLAAFTLPTGYRPPLLAGYPIKTGSASGAGYLDINTDGTVVPQIGSNTFVDLFLSFWTV